MKEWSTRKTNRLQSADYAKIGYYFITVCVKDKHEMLGEIHSDSRSAHVVLSEYGKIVRSAINNIPACYPGVAVDKYVIMPNHIHLLLYVSYGRLITCTPTSISTIVQQLKRYVSKQIGFSLWQKSFHDHIIRNKADYQRIAQYIDENPANWADDCYFCNAHTCRGG